MSWYGRGNCGGSWLPEEKKGHMWTGTENSGGSWPPAFPAHGEPRCQEPCKVMSEPGLPAELCPHSTPLRILIEPHKILFNVLNFNNNT